MAAPLVVFVASSSKGYTEGGPADRFSSLLELRLRDEVRVDRWPETFGLSKTQ